MTYLLLGNLSLQKFSASEIQLDELPMEIGKLTNLIMFEFWNEWRQLKRISPGVLSKLVRLEELHVLGVRHCSYSTLRELESLSRLTAVTLSKCSGDVIYSNLSLPSKLTRYALNVGQQALYTSLIAKYDRSIVLEVSETTPLGDWIRTLLRKSELVHSRGKGSKNVLTELQLDEFQNVKDLYLCEYDSLTHLLNVHCQNNTPFPKLERLNVNRCRGLHCVFCPDDEEEEISRRTHIQVIKFPNLYVLELQHLDCLTHFCSNIVEGIEFPQLWKMYFCYLPEFQNLWPTAKNSITDSNPLFHEKISCPSLEELELRNAPSITALCSHQLPTAYFSKLKTLYVWSCGKWRNLMSPSVARGILNLRTLKIDDCQSMEEVVTEEEQQEEMTNDPLFPLLEELELKDLPKLGHFFRTNCALEFPFLRYVKISGCPKMRTFALGSVITPSLKNLIVEIPITHAEVKDDLNKVLQQRFNSK